MPSFNISKILVFSFMLSLLNLTTEAAVTFLAYNCPNTTTFTPNGTYQRNLNFLLSSLTSNATRDNGFYKLTIGQDPSNMIYGLYLCRGDVTKKLCQECVTTASKELLRRCPKERVSLIYYDECLIRYSDQYFFSTVQRDPDLQLLNTQNIVEPDRFMQLLGRTINDIAARAANDQSGKMFATEEANFTIFQTLYTLAQCTPDLSVGDCDLCLRGAISNLPGCCNGKQGGRVLFPSCNVRYEVYPFYRIMEAPPPPPNGRQKTSSLTIIAIVALIAVSVLLFTGGYCYLSRKARTKYNVIQQEENVGTEIMIVESLQFDLGTIQAATNNFSDDNKLGEGGFGEVFKGMLPNGQEIAVKRLSRGSGQGAAEFKNEAVLVAKLQHRNLVRLLGFCLEGEEKMLVYEFVPNKSLDYFLFNPEKRGQLDWSRRYKMIGGIARGILYLHEDFWLRIIHRDLKARNILLDADMTPKISDFGMARIFGVDQTQGNTSRIFGTYGYMAPEYAMHGQFSVKSDVYSFGVLILETISGKKNNSFCQSEDAEDLLSYAYKLWKDGAPLELMDPTLSDSYSRNEVIRCIHIGLLCVQENPADRPSMSTIVLMLNSFSVTLPLPQQPAFFLHSRRESDMPTTELGLDQSRSQSIPWSVNEASITELQPR